MPNAAASSPDSKFSFIFFVLSHNQSPQILVSPGQFLSDSLFPLCFFTTVSDSLFFEIILTTQALPHLPAEWFLWGHLSLESTYSSTLTFWISIPFNNNIFIRPSHVFWDQGQDRTSSCFHPSLNTHARRVLILLPSQVQPIATSLKCHSSSPGSTQKLFTSWTFLQSIQSSENIQLLESCETVGICGYC